MSSVPDQRALAILGGEPADLLLHDGVIARSRRRADRMRSAIDADGLVALPGLVDLHTHLREPGREDAETVEPAPAPRRAAASPPCTRWPTPTRSPTPPASSSRSGASGRRPATATSARSAPSPSGCEGERLAELGAMADSAARVRVFSDDGKCVSDAVLMRRALEYVKAFDGVIAQHAQEPRLTEGAQMNEGTVSGVLGLRGWPAVAEEAIIARDVPARRRTSARGCTSATSRPPARSRSSAGPRARGGRSPPRSPRTTCCSPTSWSRRYDPIYKVNPPLRTADDVEALRAGLADGTIDIVATDHAPHPTEDKDCEWEAAAIGMLGLETALCVVQQAMVDTGLLDWAGVADRMSVAAGADRPARRPRPPLEAGAPANLVLVDPAATRVDRPADVGVAVAQHAVSRARAARARWSRRSCAARPTVLDGKLQ